MWILGLVHIIILACVTHLKLKQVKQNEISISFFVKKTLMQKKRLVRVYRYFPKVSSMLGVKYRWKYTSIFLSISSAFFMLIFRFFYAILKGNLISKPTWNLDINVFPAKIWIFKFIFCLKETVEMITFKFKEVR